MEGGRLESSGCSLVRVPPANLRLSTETKTEEWRRPPIQHLALSPSSLLFWPYTFSGIRPSAFPQETEVCFGHPSGHLLIAALPGKGPGSLRSAFRPGLISELRRVGRAAKRGGLRHP